MVYTTNFHADFNELLFISMALALVELFLNFEHNWLIIVSPEKRSDCYW